jgi:peptide deformylase
MSEVIYYPDISLRTRARDVTDINDEVAGVIEELTTTMAAYGHCVGLAANQLGSDLNIFVADASKNTHEVSRYGFVVVLNPVVISTSGRVTRREGCMSVPDLTGNVGRAQSAVIGGLDVNGEYQTWEVSDFEARVFLHEIDHLMGKVFLDRVKSARDVFARKKYH